MPANNSNRLSGSMQEKPDKGTYWSGMARRYAALEPPLCVSSSEIDIYRKLAEEWMNGRPAPRVLVMGATPDFYHLPWPENTDLLAADISAQMLAEVWPGTQNQRTCQDWTRLFDVEGR